MPFSTLNPYHAHQHAQKTIWSKSALKHAVFYNIAINHRYIQTLLELSYT